MPINNNGIKGRVDEYEEKELLDDEMLTFEKSISVKEMRLPSRQKRVVHELRRLNATIVDASVINADDFTTLNLHQTFNAHLAKVEKDFTCTLVVCDNKMLLFNESQGVKRQCTKGLKKYVKFYNSEENMASVVSPGLEGQEMMAAAPAAPSLTVIDTDLDQQCSVPLGRLTDVENFETFCPISSEGQSVVIEEDQWDTTFSASEVDTSSYCSFECQSDAVKEDADQEVNAIPKLEVSEIKPSLFFPTPREGFVCLCQWKYFLAAFESQNIYVWVVQMETHVFMAVTTHNVTPSVYEAISVVSITYAINEDELPLLAVLLLSGWQNDNDKNRVVRMEGMQGYWEIKPLHGNLRDISRSQISPILLVKVKQVGEILPTSTRGHLPMPEEAAHFADSFSEPEQEVASLISLDACISFSSIRDQYLKLTPMKKNDIEKEQLLTIEILDSDEEEPIATKVNMDNQNPVAAVASPLSLSQDVFAKEFPKDYNGVITSIEYLTPLEHLTDNLLDTNITVHPPPAKIIRFSNSESLQELLNSGEILTPEEDNNTNQNKVSIGSEGAGTAPVFKYPPIPITKVVAVEKPIDEIMIYPNISDQCLTNPEIEMRKEAPEIMPKQDQNVAVNIAGKAIHLDPSAPWCLIPPVSANSPDNNEFQSNERFNEMAKLPTPNTFLAQMIPAGNIRLLPKMSVPPNSAPGSQPQQRSVIPQKVWKLYPRAHMPVNSLLMQKPVSTTTIPARGEASSKVTGVRLDKESASAPGDQENLPIFGIVGANEFKPLPASVLSESTNINAKIPVLVETFFETIEEANRFLNK